MNSARMTQTLEEQAGLISRRQVLACGAEESFIERQLRRREWSRVYRGVFINHTGELSWLQRAWAAVLYYWPAALTHQSALDIQGVRTTAQRDDRIHVAVARERRVREVEGVRLHHVTNLSQVVQPNRSPARTKLEHALLGVASGSDRDSDAIAVLADACQCRRTTPLRLVAALAERRNLPRRAFLLDVLNDVAEGVHSVLEHRYLTRVERPHGLPTAQRQRHVKQGRSPAYRDVEYLGLATVIELDGRLGHEETLDRWDDMDRDIDSVQDGVTTLRAGWQQVESPCRLAVAVGRVLRAHGWTGKLKACSPTCPVHESWGGYSAPGAGNTPLPAAARHEPAGFCGRAL